MIRAFFTALLYLALAPPVLAQSQAINGTIEGTVSDTSGAVLPGVTVTVANTDTGTERSVVTNAHGLYRAPLLPLGSYRVIAELQGFKKFEQSGINLSAGQTAVVNVTLGIGQVMLVTALSWESLTGGANGLPGVPGVILFGWTLPRGLPLAAFVWSLVAVAALVSWQIMRGMLGRARCPVRPPPFPPSGNGYSTRSGVSLASICWRSPSSHAGSFRVVPRAAFGSSTRKPGPDVEISRMWPSGSRK